jgi:hypothetical protein
MDSLEDSFWEAMNPSTLYDEYFLSKTKFTHPIYFGGENALFLNLSRDILPNPTILARPLSLERRSYSQPYTYSKLFTPQPNLMTSGSFSLFNTSTNFDLGYNYYANFKNISNTLWGSSNFTHLTKQLGLVPTSYTNDLNAFRADFEEAN